ncbi:unnamed protein product, partial [Symbiodinium sp. CCMP2456]
VLMAMLGTAIICLSFRAVAIVSRSLRASPHGSVGEGDASPRAAVIPRPAFFVIALANPLLQVGTVVASGLLAVKWLLAGEEAGLPLAACFLVITVNTELLIMVSLVAHLRAILVELASCRDVRVRFRGITNLVGAPIGRVCLAWNMIAMVILLVCLREQPWKFLAWQGATLGILAWANASFSGIGASAWSDIRPLAAKVTPVMELSELMTCESPPAGMDSQTPGAELPTCEPGLRATLATLWYGTWYFNEEDGFLLRRRQDLLQQAFPTFPLLRGAHAVVVAALSLLSFGVPTFLVSYCMLQTPQLQLCDAVGGNIHPSFDPWASHHYVILREEWTAAVSFDFEMDLGQAARFGFCCSSTPCATQPVPKHQRSDRTLMNGRVAQHEFGTCSLILQGLRQRKYEFTVLAPRSLNMSLQLGRATASFQEFEVERHLYDSSLPLPSRSRELCFSATLSWDPTHIGLDSTVQLCRHQPGSCQPIPVSRAKGVVSFNHGIVGTDAGGGPFDIVVLLVFRATQHPASGWNSTYTVQVNVFSIEQRLAELARQISTQARRDALAGWHVNSEAAEAQHEYEVAIRERNKLIQQAYDDQSAASHGLEDADNMLTFVAVGLTGTGKSELCHWMTGDEQACSPSSTMPHTSDVTILDRLPFKDKRYRLLRWIDTPGRGDTRGDEKDKELWNNTMAKLRATRQRVDRIVWVLNAAWQRGASMRQLMIKELRRSFGIHLYKHLDLVFNFLPHVANKSEYLEQVLLPQRQKFLDWIMEQEMNLFSWPAILKDRIQHEINETGFYGVNIHPKFLAELPEHLPLSAPYLQQFPPFSYPAGVDELIRMHDKAEKIHNKSSWLNVDDEHPRIGPGILKNYTHTAFECGLKQQLQKGRRRMLVPGFVAIYVNLSGEYFTADDSAILLPTTVECGDPEAKGWPHDWHNHTALAVSPPSNNSGTYRFEWHHKSSQICFCEAPSCSEAWRFGQKLELPTNLEASAGVCDNVTSKLRSDHISGSASKWSGIAAVDGHLFAVPESANTVLVVDLNGSSPLAIDRVYVHSSGGGGGQQPIKLATMGADKWQNPVTFEGKVYAAPRDATDVLVIDATTKDLTRMKILDEDGSVYESSARDKWTSLAFANDYMYMVPGQSHYVVVHSLSLGNFSWIDISTYSPNLHGGYLEKIKFWGCLVVNGELFATPYSADHVLVIDTLTRNISTISTEDLYEKGPKKWSGLVHVQDRLYAAPSNADRLLVVNIAAKTLDSIDTRLVAHGKNKWSDIVAVGSRLYGIPDETETLLIVDLTTSLAYGLSTGERAQQRWSGAVVVGDRLFACPRDADYLLVVNVSVNIS